MWCSMKRQPTVVFGDDGSNGSDVAWLWLNNQEWRHWHLEVLSVTQPPTAAPISEELSRPTPLPPPHPRKWFGKNPAEFCTATGDPRAILGRYNDVGLMVIGARGKGMFKALNLGSTAEWLMASPPSPLVVVRSSNPVRRALICIDGSSHSAAAAAAFADLPLAADCDVTLLHVGSYGQQDPPELAAAETALLAAGARVRLKVVRPDLLDAFMNPRDVVLDTQHDTGADLIVMGSRGASRWRRWGAGSVTSAITRHSPVSLMIAKDHHLADQ